MMMMMMMMMKAWVEVGEEEDEKEEEWFVEQKKGGETVPLKESLMMVAGKLKLIVGVQVDAVDTNRKYY